MNELYRRRLAKFTLHQLKDELIVANGEWLAIKKRLGITNNLVSMLGPQDSTESIEKELSTIYHENQIHNEKVKLIEREIDLRAKKQQIK
jgi:hypothetical protein